MTHALVLLVPGAILLALCSRRVRHALKLIWRFASGEPLNGIARTDSHWGRPAVRVLTATGYAPRFWHMRRELRAAARLGSVALGLAVAYGLIADYGATVLALTLATVLALAASSALGVRAALTVQSGRAWVRPAHVTLGALGGVAYRAALEAAHTRRWIRPVHLALAELLGAPRAVRPKSYLAIPRDFATREGARIVVKLPAHFTHTSEIPQRAIVDLITTKLALEAPSATWQLAGKAPKLTLTTQVPPPDKVTYADMREAIAAAKETAPVLGRGRGRKLVTADLEGESPHVLVSAGSGSGKSVILRLLAAQVLSRGGLVLCLDVKRLSHSWLRQLPNAYVARDAAEIHNALLWLAEVLTERARLADEAADINGEVSIDVPRIMLLAEEMNACSGKLSAYWRSIRTKDDPPGSPALAALAEVSYMGRQMACNMVVAGQMTTARALGGPEARESLGIRILGRATVNAARMLVPEIWPFPKSSRRPGRVQVCVGGVATETQVCYITPAEARALAVSGEVAEFPPIGTGVRAVGGANVSRMPKPSGDTLEGAALVGLRQAADSLGLGLEALRSARARDPEFPAPSDQAGRGGEHLYALADLERWARNRPRAGVA